MSDRKPTFSGVQIALEKLSKILPSTPLVTLQFGDSTLWCKCESAQPVGAFKIRGAWHRLTELDANQRKAGVVAFSSGNHAQGVAWAAKKLGMSATIVMPNNAPKLKLEGTRALGAEIILYDRKTEDRVAIANRLAEEKGAVVVPAFDDPWIIEGQGSCGLEALEQMLVPPDLVVAPCGGGGLAAGLALALPDARIAIAEPEGWAAMGQALACGELVTIGPEAPRTICDSLQPPKVSPLTLDVLQSRNAEAVTVSDAEVQAAMRLAYSKLGLVIEPGGAAGLAAIMAGKITPSANTLVILSGGNVDRPLFDATIAGSE